MAIRARAGLETYIPNQVIERTTEQIALSFTLPLPSVSLLEIATDALQ